MADDQLPAWGDRRGVDTGLLAVTQSLVGEAEKRAKAYEETHRREHEELEKARLERKTAQDRFLTEWNRRLDERNIENQRAIDAAFKAAEQAIAADRAATQKAIEKSETAQAETNKATYVSLSGLNTELQRLRENLTPRGEADARFAAVIELINSLKERMDRGEGATTQEATGKTSLRDNAGLIVAVLALLLVLARDFFR
jgi:hypothetical protein